MTITDSTKKYLIIGGAIAGVVLLILIPIFIANQAKHKNDAPQTIEEASSSDGEDVFNPTQAGVGDFKKTLLDTSGLGNPSAPLAFATTVKNWQVVYTYTNCAPIHGIIGPTGIGLTLRSGSSVIDGRSPNGKLTFSDTWGPFTTLGDIKLEITTPSPQCSWQVTVTERSATP